MIKLSLGLLFFSLCACSAVDNIEITNTNTLKFSAGQKVKVLRGFYTNCTGRILNYKRYKHVNSQAEYELDLWCKGQPIINSNYFSEDMLEVCND